MSDNIPFEIQMEIIQRISDIKSVIRCRSVSKEWKSVIDSMDFVTAYTLRHSHDQAHRNLLISKRDFRDGQVKYVSIVDDDTFPHQEVSLFVPDSVHKFRYDSKIVGSCHGLFCVYQDKTSTAVIWNPCIRKTVVIAVPNLLPEKYYWTVVGFGVCPRNLDPKLIKISYVSAFGRLQDVNASTQVEVFTGGTWRSLLSSSYLPHISIDFGYSQAVVDGFIYWVAFDRIVMDDGTRNPQLIMSFNLTTEEFTKVNLPRPLALDPCAGLSVSNLRESLVVLKFNKYTPRENCDVWMMNGHGCARSFNRLYSVPATDASPLCKTLGFRKSGAPIIELKNANRLDNFYTNEHELAIYEPESKNITRIGIHGLEGKFFVRSYKETLLLPLPTIEDKDDDHIANCAFE